MVAIIDFKIKNERCDNYCEMKEFSLKKNYESVLIIFHLLFMEDNNLDVYEEVTKNTYYIIGGKHA